MSESVDPHDDLANTLIPDVDPLQTIDPTSTVNDDEEDIDSTTLGTPSEAASLVAETEEICRQFRVALQSQPLPVIEDYVPLHLQEPARTTLIERLISLELWECRKQHFQIDPSQYLSRFPKQRSAVQSAFRAYDGQSGEETLLFPSHSSNPSTQLAALETAASGTRSGSRFQPLRLHAKGGLGAVYLAKDEELGRTVALKEIRAKHALDLTSQARFVAEAIVTGSLEHPGIVPIYGMGRYQDGRPFYAMRFIKGTSFQSAIQDFHTSRAKHLAIDYFSRSFKALIRTFIDVCSAIYYAHEHGVLHRDIKPDNVMLGKFGETMVVDWGLAKVLATTEAQISDEHTNQSLHSLSNDTQVGMVMGTPAYMSPEQAKGNLNELDARSDIYSLGATLFTLLTNERPIDGKSSIDVVLNVRKGIMRRVEDITPHAPTALTAICYKAMRPSSAERYRSAGELIDDVERWLADELVLAHKDTERPLERLGRLVRRYHTWAVAGAIFLTAFTLLSILAVVLISRARHFEQIAKLQAQAAKGEALVQSHETRRAADLWLVGANDALQFYPGLQPIRKRMLQLAADDYQRLTSRPSHDADLELERARALVRLGTLYQLQLNYEAAREQFRAAARALEQMPSGLSLESQRAGELASIHTRLGIAYFVEGKANESRREYDEAIRALSALADQADASVLVQAQLANAYLNSGELQLDVDETQAAIQSLETALGLYEHVTRSVNAAEASDALKANAEYGEYAPKNWLLGAAHCRELIGRALLSTGQYTVADEVLEAAIKPLQIALFLHPDQPEYADAIASISVSRADLFRSQGLTAKLEAALAEAIEQYRALQLAIPDNPRFAEYMAMSLTDLGIAKFEQGETSRALNILTDAQQQWQSLIATYRIPRLYNQAATCEDALAQVVLEATNDFSKAFKHAENAIDTYQQLTASTPDDPEYLHRLAVASSHAATIQIARKDYDSALRYLENAKQLLNQIIEASPELEAYRHTLAHVFALQGLMQSQLNQHEDAKASFTRSIESWTELANGQNPEAANELATLYLTCPVKALRSVDNALQYAQLAGAAAPKNSRYKVICAIALMLKNQTSQAKILLDEIKSEQGQWVGQDLFARSMLSAKIGDGNEAEYRDQAKKWMQQNQPGSIRLHQIQELVTEIDSSR